MALFWKKKKDNNTSNPEELKNRAMEKTIADVEGEDPLIRLKIGGMELKFAVYNALKDDKGIHAESVLGVLGSLAGFACLMQAYSEQQTGAGREDPHAFLEIATNNGQKFYIGNLINAPLLENPMSVWKLVGGMTQHLGGKTLPDIEELVGHVSRAYGNDDFGMPRIPSEHSLSDLPINYVKHFWPQLLPILKQFSADPAGIPILLGFSIQKVMEETKDIVAPDLAAQIVMECAVPMSKIDPNNI